MSYGSLKDTLKCIQQFFCGDAQSLSPLPEELQQTIESFLERNSHIDEHDSQKLHEELLWIHNKNVATAPDKLGAFVHVLRLLQPAIRGEKRLEDWWLLVIKPVIDSIGHKRDTIEDAREFLLGVLLFDAEDDKSELRAMLSAKFTGRVLEAYMARSKVPKLQGEEISPEDEFIAQDLESILISFGKKKPLELLKAIDAELVKKERRLQALSLLSSFVRLQPPHLHLVMETSIITHLHNCLLIDLSGTVVDLALTILIMFMPHITSSLYSSLPKLLLIYARIVCWDQYSVDSAPSPKEGNELSNEKSSSDGEGVRALEMDANWVPLHRLFNTVEAIVPKANYLFTFLYGMFPLNFMAFIRKPRRYLKNRNYPHADDLNLFQDMVRKRTETHRLSHRLHPSFFTTTLEDELTDNRLLKVDPADLVTECLALCITVPTALGDPGPPPTTKLPELPKHARSLRIRPDALLAPDDESVSNFSPTESRAPNSWRHTGSSTLTAFTPCSAHPDVNFPMPPVRTSTNPDGMDISRETSPRPFEGTSPPKDGSCSRPGSRHRELKSPRTKKTLSTPSDVAQFDAVPKLQIFAQALSRSPRNSASPGGGTDTYNTAVLQREVMLLKNDLNFERFQKAQYLAQIGQLQRKHLNEATSESQTQTLLNKNRTLGDKLKKADELYAQLKKETAMSRSQSKRYEEQLSQKLKVYREEEKQRQVEVQRLRQELELTKGEVEALGRLVIESENQERDARNQLNALTVDVEDMNKLRQRSVELESKIREYELSDLDVQRAQEDHDILRTELETAQLTIDSRDAELERTRKTYEQKVVALENRLRTRTPAPSNAPLPDSVQQMIDSALAASNSKYLQIKKNYKRLNEKYTELEVQFQELEMGRHSPNSPRPGSVLSLTKYAEDAKVSHVSNMGKPYHSVRRLHAFSDPNALLEQDLSPDEDQHSLPVHRSTREKNNYANKPRFESLAGLRPLPNRGASPPPADRPSYENSFTHDFQPGPPQRQSVQALDLSAGRKEQIRMYGRGGAQHVIRKNTAGKSGEKRKESDKPAKTGGFRGLKGIM